MAQPLTSYPSYLTMLILEIIALLFPVLQFMETDLLDGLYWEYVHGDDNPKRFSCPGGEDRIGPCPVVPADRNILYENRLLGLPRIRQLRVRNDSCSIHPHFQNAIHVCYHDYNTGVEDEGAFGNGFRRRTGEDA